MEAVHSNSVARLHVLQDARTVRNIGIVLFSGFALPEAATVLEIFQSANALTETETTQGGQIRYKVCLISAAGGRVDSSSSVFVWTEGVEARRYSDGFHALFVGGGGGVRNATRDERLTTWLRRECPRSGLVVPIGEGRLLLEAAGFGRAGSSQRWGGGRTSETFQHCAPTVGVSTAFASPLHSALAVVQEDFGTEIARLIEDHVLPRPHQTRFTATIRENAPAYVSEKIQASAKWLEANGDRPISIDEAAQVAAMSERNFLRRFKIEMGVTPSEYLSYVRLDMCCRLLVETDLPVDKIARRCGLGGGGWLAKLFRKHLATTPTEYRASKRLMSTS
ncbi:AraC family transcriptional regulator [Paraburkholderia phytofirmans OLGA172]|uniref:AraC family transcriptional regulator n=2 Tax=Paraburkholderia phytofirmans TaxID=261302 RepID=A0A160FRM6_9BURK|nr:helix-turn-helix domain-containing protein [Paraburkholderia phytofirmans]ANB75659.1 AraC family transcriptional regulator [Paraburkholderia phytofirmans OLGA172]